MQPSQSRREIPPLLLAVFAAIYFAVFCNAAFWRALFEGRSPAEPATWLLIVSTFFLIAAASLFLLLPFTWRPVIKPAIAVLLVVNAVVIHYVSQFRVVIDMRMLRNVIETDQKEVADLLTLKLALALVVYAIVPGIVLFAIRLRRESFRTSARRLVIAAVVSLAIVAASALVSLRTYTAFFQKHSEAKHMVVPVNYMAATAELIGKSFRQPRGPRRVIGEDAVLGPRWKTAPARPALLLVVVGETARAQQFSLNGYGRETNPFLKQHDVINFTNVYACGTSTAEALPCMFSPLGRRKFSTEEARNSESLLDVVKRAGVRVTWLDNNSGCKKACDGVETERLDKSAIEGVCKAGECFDEILLRDFKQRIVPGENRLIVLHQKGSHGPAYYKRYPKQFERFTPACTSEDFETCTPESIRNAYDNSILYTDFFLSSVVKLLEAIETHDTAVLYVSDHGESLGEGGIYLHGLPYSVAPDAQTHVPMVLWMSPGFAARIPIDRAAMLAGAGEPLSHDNLFHSVLGALDVRTAIYRPELDIFRSDASSKSGG